MQWKVFVKGIHQNWMSFVYYHRLNQVVAKFVLSWWILVIQQLINAWNLFISCLLSTWFVEQTLQAAMKSWKEIWGILWDKDKLLIVQVAIKWTRWFLTCGSRKLKVYDLVCLSSFVRNIFFWKWSVLLLLSWRDKSMRTICKFPVLIKKLMIVVVDDCWFQSQNQNSI